MKSSRVSKYLPKRSSQRTRFQKTQKTGAKFSNDLTYQVSLVIKTEEPDVPAEVVEEPLIEEDTEDAISRDMPRQLRRSEWPISLNDLVFDPDQVSLQVESSESHVQSELQTSEDFFQNLRKAIEIDYTKWRSSSISSTATRNGGVEIKDGRFVHPLTGEDEPVVESHEDTIQSKETIVLEDETTSSEESSGEYATEIAFARDFSLDEIDERYDALAYKTDLLQSLNGIFEEKLWKDIEEEHSRTEAAVYGYDVSNDDMENEVSKFFDDMINAMVRRTEDQESQRNFEMKFDKKKLFKELWKLFSELMVENTVLRFLDRKAMDHFRRKGQTRQSLEDKAEDVERYHKHRQHLNEVLDAENAIRKKSQMKIDELSEKLYEAESSYKKEVKGFEAFVRSVFRREHMPHLQLEINKGLHHMAELRVQISAMRSVVIQRQHTLARIDQKIERLQDLGMGLHISDYEILSRQVTELSKKREDRYKDLMKSYQHFQHSVNALSHMKNTTALIVRQVQANLAKHEIALDELDMCRHYLHILIENHNYFAAKLKDLRHRVGLINKPALLRDYDKTVEDINAKKIIVSDLRKTRFEIDQKIENIVCKHSNGKVNGKMVNFDAAENSFMIKGEEIKMLKL